MVRIGDGALGLQESVELLGIIEPLQPAVRGLGIIGRLLMLIELGQFLGRVALERRVARFAAANRAG